MLEGCQEPRFSVVPNSAFTDGPACGRLASAYGLTPDPWQQLVLDGWLACRKDGRYVSGTCGLAVPRQNGKNAVLEMAELFKLAVQGRRILHTAHEVKTCRKAFMRLKEFFTDDGYPELQGLVRQIRQTNGQEAIYLHNGGSVEFIARSKSSGRGFTVDDVVLDEAQELTDEQDEVLRPTLSSAPSKNPQMILTGTPTPPSSPGTVFSRIRKNAWDGKAKRLCWFEWSVDAIGDVRDKSRWALANPALGGRLQEASVENELNGMSTDGFARERLGWWASAGFKRVIDAAAWDGCETDDAPKSGKTAFGVKFSPDGSSLALSIAIKPAGEPGYVELIDERPMSEGVTWLAQWLYGKKDKTACVVMDGLNGSEVLSRELAELKYPPKAVVKAKTADAVAAATMMLNAVNERNVRHWKQERLAESATTSSKRNIGKGGGWGFGGDASGPIESASLAYWGVMTTKRNPGRRSRIL